MPSSPWPLWIMTLLILFAFPTISFIYYPLLLESGVLPPDSDSIGIPMYGSIHATLIVSPLVLGVAWLCLRRYNPDTRLIAWRGDRPLRSIACTALFGASAVSLAGLLAADLLDPRSSDWPWFEHLWTAYFALWVAWLLGLRAAAIEQLPYDPDYVGSS